MSNFAIIRLGKDSVADIRTIDALHESPAVPLTFIVHCKQVPTELETGDYIFICFGSDNSQGAPTEWIRGIRALGTITSKTGGPGYNDPWHVSIEISVVLPQSIVRKDLLAHAPAAYYWCSGIPTIGIEANSQQTVQLIKEGEPNQDVAALAYSIAAHSPIFKLDTIEKYPKLKSLFDYRPPSPVASATQTLVMGSVLASDEGALKNLVEQFQDQSKTSSLLFDHKLAHRFSSSLLSKRFLILTGLSGSGKTKLAQAFARWITQSSIGIADPFAIGLTFHSEKVSYVIKQADSCSVEFWNEAGEDGPIKNMVPREVIREWADYIEANHLSADISSTVISEAVEKTSNFSPYLHRFRPFLKLAAFALVDARKKPLVEKAYEVVAVGADWTGNENILGYPNGLDGTQYVTKQALDLIHRAEDHLEIPHFLILDEMNLSHVERYFADLLSAIESDEPLRLHHDVSRNGNSRTIKPELSLPHNLFIIGTVNVDETTYMFSPKVLDRANVIEFRMDDGELAEFLDNPVKPNLKNLDGKGATFGAAFVKGASDDAPVPADVETAYRAEMLLFFKVLQAYGCEFGYRVAQEAARFMNFYNELGQGRFWDPTANSCNGDWVEKDSADRTWFDHAFDALVVQKFLPKLNGSEAKLRKPLWALAYLCSETRDWSAFATEELRLVEINRLAEVAIEKGASKSKEADSPTSIAEKLRKDSKDPSYQLSFTKIERMWRAAHSNGFTSFAESI
jgi:energy-coupling factor transporter ATP-binding protein EcfA2